MRASIYIYPWDIIDYGIEPCLELLKSLGLNELSVAVNYHTAKLLLPHNPRRKIYFTEPGLLYFPPDLKYYSGPLEPRESTLTAGSDFLTELIEKAQAYGIDVIAWVVCMHNSRLGFLHPEACVKTATGDRLFHTLCPVNPLARAYVKGLTGDLGSRFNLKAVELESASFMGYFHGFHHEISGIEISPSLDFLLSLCFCPYCIEKAGAAGIEIDKIHKTVSELITSELKKPSLPSAPVELTGRIPGFDRFIEWRVSTITSLIGLLKKESCQNMDLIAIATVFPPNADARLLYGADPVKLTGVCDSVTVSGYFTEKTDLAEDLNTLLAGGINPENLRVGLRPQAPDSNTYENFAAKLTIAQERSFGGVTFYNFGTMRASSFEWIRRGLK